MKVTAAVARSAEDDFSIEEMDLDEPRADEVLVRVAAVGLCHTDLVFKATGTIPHPHVLGHEGAGVVEKTGSDVTKVKPGDRVAITFRSCGHCPRCASHDPAYCHSMPLLNYAGMRPDGTKALHKDSEDIGSNFFGQSSFATHCLAYETNVVKLPDDMPFELAAPLGCGIQTGAGGVMRSLACEKGSSILILGAGAVGLSAVMGAVVQGCDPVIVLEPHEERRKLALALGATHALDPAEATDLAEAVRATVPSGVDYAFDTTGIPELLNATMMALAPKGTFGIVGIAPPGTPLPGDLMNAVTFGHTVKGIIEGDSDPDEFIPELISLYNQGRLPVDRLVKTYPLEEINRAVADQHAGQCVKVVLTMDRQ